MHLFLSLFLTGSSFIALPSKLHIHYCLQMLSYHFYPVDKEELLWQIIFLWTNQVSKTIRSNI